MKKHWDHIYKLLSKEIDPGFARRARIILENIDIKPRMKLLEIGCGRGFYLRAIATIFPHVSVTGLDVNDKYLEQARRTVEGLPVRLIKGDGQKLPFPDWSFDRIICTEVLEHIDDDRGALAEAQRVLKPGGIAIYTVPNSKYPFLWDPLNWILEHILNTHIPSHIWWLAGIWADHKRLYSEKEFTGKVQGAKFHIERLWRSTHFSVPFSHFLLYGIGKNIVETGWVGSFNRFNKHLEKQSKSFPLRLVLGLFGIFDRLNETYDIKMSDSYLNIIIKARS